MGQRQGGVGPHHRRRVRGRGAAVGLAVRVEGARLGRGRQPLALQRSGRLRDGLAGEVGLGGSLDLRRQRPGRRPGAAIRRRVRRPGQRTRPEPLPAQGVPTGQTGSQGKDVRDRPRRLRTVHKREQGRRRRARPRLDGLRQAHPVPDLRRHTAARGGTQRPRRRPRRRLVRRILRFRSQTQGRPLRSAPAASSAARRRVRGRHDGEPRDRRLVEMLDGPDPLLRPPHGRVLRRPEGDARLGRARLRRLGMVRGGSRRDRGHQPRGPAGRGDQGHRRAGSEGRHRAGERPLRLRPGQEHGRVGASEGRGRGRDRSHPASRRGPEPGRYDLHRQPALAPGRPTLRAQGEGEEIYEPRFTFHGFRYVEVTGYPGEPPLGAITGRVVHSATPPSGSFECSSRWSTSSRRTSSGASAATS